jgi:hypothetical protein
MDDLKERLRKRRIPVTASAGLHEYKVGERPDPLCTQALAYIEALEQRVSELEEALSDVRRRLEYGLQNAGLDCLESALRIDAVLAKARNEQMNGVDRDGFAQWLLAELQRERVGLIDLSEGELTQIRLFDEIDLLKLSTAVLSYLSETPNGCSANPQRSASAS